MLLERLDHAFGATMGLGCLANIFRRRFDKDTANTGEMLQDKHGFKTGVILGRIYIAKLRYSVRDSSICSSAVRSVLSLSYEGKL